MVIRLNMFGQLTTMLYIKKIKNQGVASKELLPRKVLISIDSFSFVLWKLEKIKDANSKNHSAHYRLLAFIDISIQAKELTNDRRTINSENTVVNQCIELLI